MGRRSVFHYLDAFLTGGFNALLKHENKRGSRQPRVVGAAREAFLAQPRDGKLAKDAQAWIEARTNRSLSLAGVIRCWEKPAAS